MNSIFKIIELHEQEKNDKRGVAIAIDLKVAGKEQAFPVSKICYSDKELVLETEAIKKNLEQITKEAERILSGESVPEQDFTITAEMTMDQAWSILSRIPDLDTFIRIFNDLEDTRRRQVAEYVLTKCNAFSGRAAIFSSRYNNHTSLLE